MMSWRGVLHWGGVVRWGGVGHVLDLAAACIQCLLHSVARLRAVAQLPR
jgi:hypothetical protein